MVPYVVLGRKGLGVFSRFGKFQANVYSWSSFALRYVLFDGLCHVAMKTFLELVSTGETRYRVAADE